MSLPHDLAEKMVVQDLRGNVFVHGLPLDADPPVSWCHTSYPSLLCTCGISVLLWAYAPTVVLEDGMPLYAFPSTLPFVHAADPATGAAPICETASRQQMCTCGRFLLQWDADGEAA